MFSWLWQRISGIGLEVLLAIHLVEGHLRPLTFEALQSRLNTLQWRFIDGILLLLAVSHGLNGLWQIAKDYLHSETWKRVLKASLWVIGIFMVLLGLEVFFR